jgi:hypothetical protein
MSTQVRRVARAATSAAVIALSATSGLGSTAFAAESDETSPAAPQRNDETESGDVELPPEVRELLDAEPSEPTHSETPDAPPPPPRRSPAPAAAPELWVPPLPGPRRSADESLATGASTDPFLVMSVATLIAGGAFAALGVALVSVDDSEQVCGQIAGCVDVRSRSSLGREGAGYSLMGAGVGSALTGGLSLLASLASAPDAGEVRGSAGQGVVGMGFLGAGGALFGGGIAGAVAGSRRVSDGVAPALVAGGLASGILGVVLVSARPSSERRSTSDFGSFQPAISVGVGSAQAVWSF